MTDTSGITVTSGTLTGTGTVAAALAGAGAITASGGTLTLSGTSIASSLTLSAAAGAQLTAAAGGYAGTYSLIGDLSTLSISGTPAAGAAVQFDSSNTDAETLLLPGVSSGGTLSAVTGFGYNDKILLPAVRPWRSPVERARIC